MNCVAFSPDGHHALSRSDDGQLTRWNLAKGNYNAVGTLSGHSDAVVHVAFLDDDMALSASKDGSLVVWKLKEGEAPIARFLQAEEVGIDCASSYCSSRSDGGSAIAPARIVGRRPAWFVAHGGLGAHAVGRRKRQSGPERDCIHEPGDFRWLSEFALRGWGR